MMLDNSDPTIKNTNYKIITTAGEIYKYLLTAIDENGNIYYGINKYHFL